MAAMVQPPPTPGDLDMGAADSSCCSDDTVLSVGNESSMPPHDLAPRPPSSHEPLSFKNIESHLQAISAAAAAALNAGASSNTCSPPPKSPSTSSYFSSYSRDSSSPAASMHQADLDDMDESDASADHVVAAAQHATSHCLKFSIDNILKADFGRRITDPIHRKNRPQRMGGGGGAGSVMLPGSGGGQPVDLRKADQTTLTTTTTTVVSGTVTATPKGGGSSAPPSTSPIPITTPDKGGQPILWPAWVYCTRYSDRPSSGRSPRTRRVKKPAPSGSCSKSSSNGGASSSSSSDEKRPRTAFSGAQLARLKHEFAENRYLTERRRQQLSAELGLNEAQIKIWFQNKRAKIKKASGQKNPLALQLMAQGLYNHSTIPLTKEEEELQELHNTSHTKT